MHFDKVKEYVKSYDVNLDPIHFEESTSTVNEAAAALGVEPGQIAKSIVFRSRDNKFAMVVAAGDIRVNQKKLKDVLGSKPKMATPK
ncbi:MAG TPA: YbaK/EbsC family protein, partial [Clostridia bacterium]|nr:YbaK/EbsC family protein [Clostridia bacterium]